jgi:hypothetical protein
MANAFVSTTELLQLGDGNISDIDVTELLEDTPFLAQISAIVASNMTSHEWLKKTTAPTAGARAINDGLENTKAAYTKVTQTLRLFDAGFDMDIGLLKAANGDRLMRREAIDHLKAAFVAVEKQLFYGTGTGGLSAGFAGFSNETTVDRRDDVMVVNATGTTANSASSVWAVRVGESAVSVVYGANGRIEIGESYMTLRDGSSTGSYDAMRTPITFYAGCQVATSLDLGRIVNLTAESGKGLTDLLIAQLLAKFPAGRGPTHLVMNRQSHMQLRNSRTATNPTGAPAPFPSEAFGVPIVVTDQLSITEPLVAASS